MGVGPDQERSFQGAGEADRPDQMSSDKGRETAPREMDRKTQSNMRC